VQIEISLQDGVPIYRQIVNQVKYLIAAGKLRTDEELPAIRVLAERLSVTPNTVVKAYGVLQTEGLVYKRQGAGTFVAETKSPLARKEQKRILTQRTDALLADASQLGFTFEEILALLRKRHEALNKGKSGGGER
jgi:GntR family transcriptional regulator